MAQISLPGEWVTQGEKLTVAGQGCRPRSTVSVLGTASHASGRVIGTGQTTASGRFAVLVTAPYLEPNVTLVATCLNTAGSTITPAQEALSFVSPSAPVSATLGSDLTVAGKGCHPDSTVLVESLQLASHGSPVIARGTTSDSGSFSVTIQVPQLTAAHDVIYAACQNPWPAEILYPAYIPVNYTAAS